MKKHTILFGHLLGLISILILSCGSQVQLPRWVMEPSSIYKSEDGEMLYFPGVCEADMPDFQSAIDVATANALRNMSVYMEMVVENSVTAVDSADNATLTNQVVHDIKTSSTSNEDGLYIGERWYWEREGKFGAAVLVVRSNCAIIGAIVSATQEISRTVTETTVVDTLANLNKDVNDRVRNTNASILPDDPFSADIDLSSFGNPKCVVQEKGIKYEKTFGGKRSETGTGVVALNDGGLIVAGYTTSMGNGGKDVYVVRMDANWAKVWEKTFGGADSDTATAIDLLSDGSYIIAGSTYSDSREKDNFFLVKIDRDGNKVWEKKYGSNGNEGFNDVYAINGGFLATGTVYLGSFSGKNNFYLARFDNSGNQLWEKKYGGEDDDEAKAVYAFDDGSACVVGSTESFGSGEKDMFIVRVDSNGNELWTKYYGGSEDDDGYAIIGISDGGFILSGYTKSAGNGAKDLNLIKINSRGNEVWNKTFGGSSDDMGYSIAQADDGGFIIVGGTSSYGDQSNLDVYILKVDSRGNQEWFKTFGGQYMDGAMNVYALHNKFTIAGYSVITGEGNEEIYLIRIDSAGQIAADWIVFDE